MQTDGSYVVLQMSLLDGIKYRPTNIALFLELIPLDHSKCKLKDPASMCNQFCWNLSNADQQILHQFRDWFCWSGTCLSQCSACGLVSYQGNRSTVNGIMHFALSVPYLLRLILWRVINSYNTIFEECIFIFKDLLEIPLCIAPWCIVHMSWYST